MPYISLKSDPLSF